jgi:Family of unknown function (DUF6194)
VVVSRGALVIVVAAAEFGAEVEEAPWAREIEIRDPDGNMPYPVELVDQDAIIRYVTDTFTDVEVMRPTDGPGEGDTFLYYDPQHNLDPTRQFPFATIVTKDYGAFDAASDLNRPDVFRLNIGVSRDTFRALFGHPPTGYSTKGTYYDFAALDRLMPHPAYSRQSWVCVLNPSPQTFEAVKPLLAETYSRVATRHARSQINRD